MIGERIVDSVLIWNPKIKKTKRKEMLNTNLEPNEIEYHKSGKVSAKFWKKDGKLHNEFGPSIIYYSKDGITVESEHHYLHGMLHRESGPSRTYYQNDGKTPKLKFWEQCGKLSGIQDEPAFVEFRKDGTAFRKHWFQNNVRSRSTGPAVIEYRENGTILNQQWFFFGKEYPNLSLPLKKEDVKAYLAFCQNAT